MSHQLVFDFPVRPALGRGDFIVSSGNAAAVSAIETWPDWPMPGFAVIGPSGAGKSHLAAVFAAESGAVIQSMTDLATCDDATPLVLEWDGNSFDEEALFHLINRRKAAQAPLLLTGRDAPNHWPVKLPDLRSRLATFTVVEIGLPDDALLSALFLKHFADRQLQVDVGVVEFLTRRVDRSFSAVANMVNELDQLSLGEGRSITIPLARKALSL